MGLVIYPVFGHWVWGSGFIADNTPWLAGLGFIDFAGSSVVHMVGAGVAAVGVMMLGPRLGRYDADGNLVELKAHSFPFAGLGVIILWFGWIGFNGGSELAFGGGERRAGRGHYRGGGANVGRRRRARRHAGVDRR